MQTRPINLNLITIKFPVTAIISILHRITGVILFFAMPVAIYALQQSLLSAQDFQTVSYHASHGLTGLCTFVALASLLFHMFAGVRHLLMDLGLFEEKLSGKVSARTVLSIATLLIIICGVCLLW